MTRLRVRTVIGPPTRRRGRPAIRWATSIRRPSTISAGGEQHRGRADQPGRRERQVRGQEAEPDRADEAAGVHPDLHDRGGRGRRRRVEPDHRELQQPRPRPAEPEAEDRAEHQRGGARAPRAAPARRRRAPGCPRPPRCARRSGGRPASRAAAAATSPTTLPRVSVSPASARRRCRGRPPRRPGRCPARVAAAAASPAATPITDSAAVARSPGARGAGARPAVSRGATQQRGERQAGADHVGPAPADASARRPAPRRRPAGWRSGSPPA